MRLSDILGNMDLSIYPIIAMVIFAGVFVIAMVRVAMASRLRIASQAALALHDPNDAVIGSNDLDDGPELCAGAQDQTQEAGQ